jgi:hypothetical protein
MRTWISGPAFAALTLLTMVACGGGGGGSGGNGGSGGTPNPPPGGGTTPPPDPIIGINGGGKWNALGPLSTFGSIVVIGVRYEVGDAEFLVNGQPATQADLKQGQVVFVVGNVDDGGLTGQAERVVYEHNLRGTITAIDLNSRTFTALGQNVQVGVDTIFGASIPIGGIEVLAVGDAILISGFVDSLGRLVATRIDRDLAPGTAELRGVVSGVDAAASRFSINGLVVDYGSATLAGFASGAPANGDTVFVSGPTPAAGQPLLANLVSWRAGGVDAAVEDNVFIEGLVTAFRSAADFDVAGQAVLTTDSTVFVGSSLARLERDALVSVEGALDQQRRLVAVRVEVAPRADTEIEARIDGVDLAAGTIQMLGIDVHTTARTRYEDDDDDRPITLGDLRPGDGVEVAGYSLDGRFIAVRIERDDDDDDDSDNDVGIEGPIRSVAAPEFRIAGIRILTTALTEFELDDAAITAAEFFAIALGRTAELEGSWNGEVVVAEEIGLDE